MNQRIFVTAGLAAAISLAAGAAPIAAAAAPKPAAAPKEAAPKTPAISTAEAGRLGDLFNKATGMTADAVAPVIGPLGHDFVEVIAGTKVFYLDRGGKYLIDGHYVDLSTKSSLTAQRMLTLQQAATANAPKLDPKSVNFADAVKTVRGNVVAGRVIVAFEDPNCGYCKALQRELEKMNDVVVYTFQIPILGPGSVDKNKAIWCGADHAKLWADAMHDALAAAPGACDTAALDRNIAFAAKMQVRGTPALFFADGSRMDGFADAATLEQRIATASAAAAPTAAGPQTAQR